MALNLFRVGGPNGAPWLLAREVPAEGFVPLPTDILFIQPEARVQRVAAERRVALVHPEQRVFPAST